MYTCIYVCIYVYMYVCIPSSLPLALRSESHLIPGPMVVETLDWLETSLIIM